MHPTFLPALCIGDHQVIRYDAAWLGECLMKAALASGRGEDWPALDIAIGTLGYLESSFPRTEIRLEELQEIVISALLRLDEKEVAKHVCLTAPTVEFSFLDLVCESHTAYELGFFARLAQQMGSLLQTGAACIEAIQLRPAILRLTGAKVWTARCTRLQDEIVEFSRDLAARSEKSGQCQLWCR